MYGDNQRYSVSELLVHSLVMPDFHATPGTYTSANDGQKEQGGFRNTPFPFFSLQFVNAIHD